jgi:metallo-beta-lactamase family protein
MKIQFCGAAQTVTGSCYYIESESTKFLVDCGAYQGPQEIEDKNRDPFPFDPSKLDYVFLTHAHFDHCGRLPILVKQGFRGRVISTQPTRDLARIVLLDAANLQQEDFERWEARVIHRTRCRRGNEFV